MSDNATRVRYGRTDVERVVRATKSTPSHTVTERIPKNTLTTVRNGNMVYFGIARCNSGLDRFSKNIGKLIASNRAEIAAVEGGIRSTDLEIHKSGLRGSVGLDKIKTLLQYFRAVDVTMQPEHLRVV